MIRLVVWPKHVNLLLLQALGVTVDMTSRTMGVRTRRFAMYVDNGEVSTCPNFVVCTSKGLCVPGGGGKRGGGIF